MLNLYIRAPMKIERLHIKNYKSLKDLELKNPSPFSVFVGPNGAGKSNIFEALEFFSSYATYNSGDLFSAYGGDKSVLNYDLVEAFSDNSVSALEQSIEVQLPNKPQNLKRAMTVSYKKVDGRAFPSGLHFNMFRLESNSNIEYTLANAVKRMGFEDYSDDFKIYPERFTRIFNGNVDLVRFQRNDDSKLSLDGKNLEKVLNRILKDNSKREEIVEWLQVLVPEFKDIKIDVSSLSGDVNYVIYERHTNKPFPKHLISDGTKNILALLTAVYQSDEPQFLCIEEPENGLHPHVIEHLVSLFRSACKEKGHFIWLNSHSQTLVRQLTVDEIIVVEKKKGETTARQFQNEEMFGLKMDEAWLTNALGGGLP